MKSEGRQHGMMRCYKILPNPSNPRHNTRIVTRLDSPPSSGHFTKVPSKPTTNHSNFTAKCDTPRWTDCHVHPLCKSKVKSKGSQKHKPLRVLDCPDSYFSGLSATSMLDHISSGYMDDDDDEVEDESSDHVDYHANYSHTLDYGDWVDRVDSKCILDQMDQVEVETDEDWCLVESCS